MDDHKTRAIDVRAGDTKEDGRRHECLSGERMKGGLKTRWDELLRPGDRGLISLRRHSGIERDLRGTEHRLYLPLVDFQGQMQARREVPSAPSYEQASLELQ